MMDNQRKPTTGRGPQVVDVDNYSNDPLVFGECMYIMHRHIMRIAHADDCLLTSKCDNSPPKEQIDSLLLNDSNFSDILKAATSHLLACEDFNMSTLSTPEIKCNGKHSSVPWHVYIAHAIDYPPAWPYTAPFSNTHSNAFDGTFSESFPGRQRRNNDVDNRRTDSDMSPMANVAMEQCTIDTPSLLKQLMPNGVQQGNFLPVSDVEAVLTDVEQPSYTVIDEQPIPVPADVAMRALSHDHDYYDKVGTVSQMLMHTCNEHNCRTISKF